jgi:hypothetical protein
VGLKAGLDAVQKRIILPLSGLEVQFLGFTARIPSLYQLSYDGSSAIIIIIITPLIILICIKNFRLPRQ